MALARIQDPDDKYLLHLEKQRAETLRQDVDRIYQKVVVIKKEQRKHSMAYCKTIIERVVDYIKNKSSIFRGVLICVGSAYQGFKVGEANEYDYNIPLNISSPFGQAEYLPGAGLYGFNDNYQDQEMTLATIPDDCKIFFGTVPSIPDPPDIVPSGPLSCWHDELNSQRQSQSQSQTQPSDLRLGLRHEEMMWAFFDLQSVANVNPRPSSSPHTRSGQPQPDQVGPGFRYAWPRGSRDKARFESLDASEGGTPEIIPFLVRKALFRLLVTALRDLNLGGNVKIKKRNNWPALTLDISEDGSFVASVDFTPIIGSRDFTPPEKINLPRRGKYWPTPAKIAQIQEHHGPNLVAMRPFHWQISYAECEKELARNLDFDGGCRKKAHRIMKEINKTIWCPTTKSAISSYMLKNILFWECEKYPETERWVQDKLWIRIESMTTWLLHALEIKYLPQYFDTWINLVEQRDQKECAIAKEKVKKFLDNPMDTMRRRYAWWNNRND